MENFLIESQMMIRKWISIVSVIPIHSMSNVLQLSVDYSLDKESKQVLAPRKCFRLVVSENQQLAEKIDN